MSNTIKNIVPYIFVTVLGVLLHFTYEWSNNNFYVGLFSATSESTWEHLKLAFFPMLILTIYQAIYTYSDDTNFLPKRTAGIFAAMIFIVAIFYTYIGVLGRSIDIINIIIYFLGIAFGFYIESKVSCGFTYSDTKKSVVLLFVFTIIFMVLTYSAPDVGIFENPQSDLLKG